MRFRMLPIVAAIAVGAALSGCSSDTPIVTPKPQSSATPVFSSDEEALAAATDAYAKYLAVSDEISADAGLNPERIAAYVTSEQLERERAGFKEWSDTNESSNGRTTFDKVSLQQYLDNGQSDPVVVIYLCVDVTAVQVLSADGRIVALPGRSNRFPLEVEFQVAQDSSKSLFVARSESWPGQNFCI